VEGVAADEYERELVRVHIATAKRMKADGHTGKDIAKFLGVSRATLYRYLTDVGAA
jgi:DNA invertase Pin-like site-specific DNA recombinase